MTACRANVLRRNLEERGDYLPEGWRPGRPFPVSVCSLGEEASSPSRHPVHPVHPVMSFVVPIYASRSGRTAVARLRNTSYELH